MWSRIHCISHSTVTTSRFEAVICERQRGLSSLILTPPASAPGKHCRRRIWGKRWNAIVLDGRCQSVVPPLKKLNVSMFRVNRLFGITTPFINGAWGTCRPRRRQEPTRPHARCQACRRRKALGRNCRIPNLGRRSCQDDYDV